MAILVAFRRGKKAIYTSPIKALSNQKYYEFKEWFAKRNLKYGVTLLTGDIKIRSPPGTARELIICTSEILRNKLVKAAGAESTEEAPPPPPKPPRSAAGSGVPRRRQRPTAATRTSRAWAASSPTRSTTSTTSSAARCGRRR